MNAYNYALGMIETWGFPALVAAADAAAKAANVRVFTYEGADAGIVTVYVIGDVSSVQAAVNAGREAAQRVGKLLHSHVIPRPDEHVTLLIRKLWEESDWTVDELPGYMAKPSESAENTKDANTSDSSRKLAIGDGEADLQAMSIHDLRRLARSFASFPMTPQEINAARKEELIRLLSQAGAAGKEAEGGDKA